MKQRKIKKLSPSKVLSLTRFYHYKIKKYPCWVAGRFFKKNLNHFILRSQGLSLTCESSGFDLSDIKTANWLAVKLRAKKRNSYQIGEYLVLNKASHFFKEKTYSYQQKGLVLQKWRKFIRAVEDFFIQEGLAYCSTPHLVKCPGTEPHLKALKTSFKKNYLATSPEMHLKRLLCQDWTDFFEIKTCYREEEISSHHQVEFTLLEWYRAFYSSQELIKESYKLLLFLQKKGFFKILPYKIFTVAELFKKHLGFCLTPKSSKQDLMFLIKKHQINASLKDSFEDMFFLLFLNKIETKLPKKNPVFICDYPPKLRAFARINQKGWADRFELYWQGLELANAFYEIIDPLEQKYIFQDHLKQRKDNLPLDDELLKDMKMAMPPVSGIALGLDRLFLAILKKQNLKQIRLFPF